METPLLLVVVYSLHVPEIATYYNKKERRKTGLIKRGKLCMIATNPALI